MPAWLIDAVALIAQDEERVIQECLLGFGLSDSVLLDALAAVPGFPVEPLDACEVDHCRPYIASIYGGHQSPAFAPIRSRSLAR